MHVIMHHFLQNCYALVIKRKYLAMTLLALFIVLKSIINSNISITEQIKIKRKIKIMAHVIMVVFDQIITMTTLSLHPNYFLNYTL